MVKFVHLHCILLVIENLLEFKVSFSLVLYISEIFLLQSVFIFSTDDKSWPSETFHLINFNKNYCGNCFYSPFYI